MQLIFTISFQITGFLTNYLLKTTVIITQGYPATVDAIRKEAMLDVPPLLRRYVWSALLEIKGMIIRHT